MKRRDPFIVNNIMKLRGRGLSIQNIAIDLQVSPRTVRDVLGEQGISVAREDKWSAGEVRKMREMCAAGFTYEDIGRLLGRTRNAVKNKANQNEIFVMRAALTKPVIDEVRVRMPEEVYVAMLMAHGGFPVANAERGRAELAKRAA